jgi:tellurite resistance protein TerC
MNNHPIYSEHPWLIVTFAIAVLIMLIIDLGIFNKKSHVVSNKEAIIWSSVWISLAMLFSGLVIQFCRCYQILRISICILDRKSTFC